MGRIETRLKELGLNWAELARRVGKKEASGSQWSGRRVFPREGTLHEIAKVLEVGVGWLLTGGEPLEERLAQTTTEKDMLRLLRDMTPEQQRVVLASAAGIKAGFTKK